MFWKAEKRLMNPLAICFENLHLSLSGARLSPILSRKFGISSNSFFFFKMEFRYFTVIGDFGMPRSGFWVTVNRGGELLFTFYYPLHVVILRLLALFFCFGIRLIFFAFWRLAELSLETMSFTLSAFSDADELINEEPCLIWLSLPCELVFPPGFNGYILLYYLI